MAYTTINKSTDYFNTKLYTGNAGTQSITGVGFQPDLTWIKRRNTTGGNMWTDAVRGVTKTIISNETSAEQTFANGLTAFGTDGFTVGSEGGFNSSNTIASWNWKANGAGSANTNGSINSTVSVNTTAGFSIVKWTGTGSAATIGHGLGAVPKMIITKNLDEAQNWFCYHTSLGATKYIRLNITNASGTSSAIWNDTEPTTSLFSVGNDTAVNGSSDAMIAYCFAEKTGYSKFGSYIGNGSSSSPTFIYTGFKPKFVIVKNTSQADSWFIHDDKRDGYNDDNEYLFTDLSNAEGTNVNRLSMYSNGFNVPTTDKSHNVSGNSYIYMAFGQSIVGSNNVPATAR